MEPGQISTLPQSRGAAHALGAAGSIRPGPPGWGLLVSAGTSWRRRKWERGMKMTQRNVTLALLIFLTAGTLLLLISEYFTGIETKFILYTAIGSFISGILLYIYWRWPDWKPTRYLVVVTISLLIALLTPEPYVTDHASLTIFMPPALALILTSPAWVVGSMILVYLALLARAGGHGAYANPVTLLISVIILSGMVLGRLIADTAQHAAEVNADNAEAQKQRAEAQARELADANELMSHQLE